MRNKVSKNKEYRPDIYNKPNKWRYISLGYCFAKSKTGNDKGRTYLCLKIARILEDDQFLQKNYTQNLKDLAKPCRFFIIMDGDRHKIKDCRLKNRRHLELYGKKSDLSSTTLLRFLKIYIEYKTYVRDKNSDCEDYKQQVTAELMEFLSYLQKMEYELSRSLSFNVRDKSEIVIKNYFLLKTEDSIKIRHNVKDDKKRIMKQRRLTEKVKTISAKKLKKRKTQSLKKLFHNKKELNTYFRYNAILREIIKEYDKKIKYLKLD